MIRVALSQTPLVIALCFEHNGDVDVGFDYKIGCGRLNHISNTDPGKITVVRSPRFCGIYRYGHCLR